MNVTFARRSLLRKHILVTHFRIHSVEKPHGCAECGKWYSDCSDRNRHIKTHHKELS